MVFRRKNQHLIRPHVVPTWTTPPPPPPPGMRKPGGGTEVRPGGDQVGIRCDQAGTMWEREVGTRWGGGQVRWEPLVPTRSPFGRVSRRGDQGRNQVWEWEARRGPHGVPTGPKLCPHVVTTWSPHGPHVAHNARHGLHVAPIVATWSPSCSCQGQCQ